MKFTRKDMKHGIILIDKNRDKWFYAGKSNESGNIYKPVIIHMNKGIIKEYSISEFMANFDFYLRATNSEHVDMEAVIPLGCAKSYLIERPCLDSVELDYLKNIIRPFQKRVDFVILVKNTFFLDQEKNVRIKVHLKDHDFIILPFFKEGTMYKAMQPNVKYTLKDLGITYE